MQILGTAVLATVLASIGRWPALSGEVFLWAAGLAVLGVVSLYFLYWGMALGPIAVVSPITAAYAALTVLLVVALLGERLALTQAGAIVLVFAGVLLASTDTRQLVASLRRPLPGVRIGVLAMIGFGLWGTLLAAARREHDALALVLAARMLSVVLLALVVLALRSRVPAGLRAPRALWLVAATGVFDTLANVFYAVGFESGQASIVATGSAAYPLLPAFLAVAVLGERLAPNQYLGVAVLVVGLVALGLVS